MNQPTQEKIKTTISYLTSTIKNCKTAKEKMKEGSPQHSLLINRIKALEIAKAILEKASQASSYSLEELQQALPPLLSILQKTTKAQSKYKKEDRAYKRFETIIGAVQLAKHHVEEEIKRR